MGIKKWFKEVEDKRLQKVQSLRPELSYFSKSDTVEGARFQVSASSWGSDKKSSSWNYSKEDSGTLLIIACKAKKVSKAQKFIGLNLADTNKPDKILIVTRGVSGIIATYSLKQIKRIAELEKTTKLMHKIFNYDDKWKRLREVKIGVEFTDGKWATILINFKTERNEKIKAGKLLMNAGAGSSPAPF